MPERLNIVYGVVEGNKNAIVEIRFNADTWELKKSKNILGVRRKDALDHGTVIKSKE